MTARSYRLGKTCEWTRAESGVEKVPTSARREQQERVSLVVCFNGMLNRIGANTWMRSALTGSTLPSRLHITTCFRS